MIQLSVCIYKFFFRLFSFIIVVQSLNLVWLFVTPWTAAHQASPVLHHLPEFAQAHVHWVSDVIQPSHPVSPPSPLALNFSRHPGLFQWVGTSHQLARVLELQHQSFQPNIQSWFPLGLTGLISVQSKGLSKVFSNTTVWKHQLSLSLLYGPTLPSVHDYWKKHSLD